MRRTLRVPNLRRGHMAVGALILAIPASAGAVSAGRALADTVSPQSSGSLSTHVKSHRIGYGQDVVVVGTAPASLGGQPLQLQFAPAGGSGSWSTVASSSVGGSGRFRLAARLERSGLVRVVQPSGGVSPSASAASSSTHAVAVAARLHVRSQTINDLGGHPVDIRGRLLPAVGGRKVRLEGRSGGGWHTLATARTRAGGHFDLHYTPSGAGQVQLRVRFSGDRANAWTGAHAGVLTVFQPTVASWYNDGGTTGCGFHAYYGVANRTLPCGTHVTFLNGGRTVTATVDDRGPYVGGRDWDLNQNTAAALGFGGVGTVWASL